MLGLTLFQFLFTLTAAALTAAILINALFKVLLPKQDWRHWGPFD
ncbi:hypothetical protein [Pseudorhodobacter sp. E13]|nr:hypothetical protein [Pseudorhodobacter sp. E13]